MCSFYSQRKYMIMNGVLMASSLLVVSFSLVLVDRCDSATKKVSAVRRRISGDFLKYYEPDYWTHVCSSHSTYLVLEDQCINNSKLFNGKLHLLYWYLYTTMSSITYSECSFAITPKGQPQNLSIILGIGINGTSTALTATRDRIANAAVTFKDTGQPVNSSTCQISSLEVYRGREQAIEISHQGFSLSDDCSIEVQANNLN